MMFWSTGADGWVIKSIVIGEKDTRVYVEGVRTNTNYEDDGNSFFVGSNLIEILSLKKRF